MYLIKHCFNQWDCFSGSGYATHSRFKISPKTKMVSLVSGQKLPQEVVKNMAATMDYDKHYQTIPE